ncbi:MAG: hypothetical protein AMJ69_03190 [Gammaproteobacteria bacterium SG8_47]|nr:MAG: hypothetical protein AMJ69_03190 [Gammaproteobacteria bacterium SG8_47]
MLRATAPAPGAARSSAPSALDSAPPPRAASCAVPAPSWAHAEQAPNPAPRPTPKPESTRRFASYRPPGHARHVSQAAPGRALSVGQPRGCCTAQTTLPDPPPVPHVARECDPPHTLTIEPPTPRAIS